MANLESSEEGAVISRVCFEVPVGGSMQMSWWEPGGWGGATESKIRRIYSSGFGHACVFIAFVEFIEYLISITTITEE